MKNKKYYALHASVFIRTSSYFASYNFDNIYNNISNSVTKEIINSVYSSIFKETFNCINHNLGNIVRMFLYTKK